MIRLNVFLRYKSLDSQGKIGNRVFSLLLLNTKIPDIATVILT